MPQADSPQPLPLAGAFVRRHSQTHYQVGNGLHIVPDGAEWQVTDGAGRPVAGWFGQFRWALDYALSRLGPLGADRRRGDELARR